MNRKLKLAILLLFGVGTIVCLPSCQPSLPTARPSDAGNHSFARRIVPTLLGRKPKGYDEIKLLADLSVVGGRESVVRALMMQPEYVNQWSETIVDQLRITRASSDPKYQGTCFGAPLRSGSDGGALADWVRSHLPNAGAAPGGSFNMTDLLRSALELDDLSPVYRAYLFAMMNHPLDGNQIVEMNKRDDFGVNFGRVYIHRQMLCLSCHSSDYSVSGSDSGWNRTYPVPGSFERAVYGDSYASIDTRRTNAVFRTDVNSIATGAIQPWGLSSGCGKFQQMLPDDDPTEGLPANMTGYFISDTGRTGSIWNVETALDKGYTELRDNGVVRTGTDANGDGWLDTVDGNAGFAFMVAANSVNQTWTEVMGYPVTIANYYPRNNHQLNALWSQSEYNFIRNHWSLRGVLEEVVLSDFYNRKPPQTSDGTTAYELPMLFDPWIAADPRVTPTPAGPENYNNSMGEIVHRYSPRTLLYSIHAALDWPAPLRFPDSSKYPDDDLEKAIGQFFKDAEPGFKGVDFQGLLYWESIHGAGVKPLGFTGTDWVDRLKAAISSFNAANPNAQLKLSEVIATTKDWIIGDSVIYTATPDEESGSEVQALQTLFAVSSLDTPAAGVAQLETKLRQYVGVLLESPQFFLAGITPAGLGTRPRLRVCNSGPCSYQQLCVALQPAYSQQGYVLTCNADSVAIAAISRIDPNDYKICPPGLCGFVYLPHDFPKCILNPTTSGSCRLEPPHCDPRCRRIDCCGGPMPPPDSNFALLAWADGGKVQKAEGVRLLPKGKKEFETLSKGAVLNTGDILIIPARSQLQIETKGGKFSTTRRGMISRFAFQPKTEQLKAVETEDYWVMLVTGPSALLPPAKPGALRTQPQPATDLLLNTEGLKRGEAGPPVDPNAKQHIDERRMNPGGSGAKPQPSSRPSP